MPKKEIIDNKTDDQKFQDKLLNTYYKQYTLLDKLWYTMELNRQIAELQSKHKGTSAMI